MRVAEAGSGELLPGRRRHSLRPTGGDILRLTGGQNPRLTCDQGRPRQIGEHSLRLTAKDGDEVPAPAQEVLVGGAVLARHLGRQRPARPGRDVKLNPFRVDVQFHADPRAMVGQRLGEVLGLADMLPA